MREYFKENFRKEKYLDLYLVSLQRRVEVLNLLGILLDSILIQLVLLKLSDHCSLLDWACHHRVLPLKVEQCQRSVHVVAIFIPRLVVHHNYIFNVDKHDMLKGSAQH